jgi:hypothetical protein
MTRSGWRVRPGSPDDRELLAAFDCADPAVRWQAEVEHFIQTQLTDWAFDPHAGDGDPQLPKDRHSPPGRLAANLAYC